MSDFNDLGYDPEEIRLDLFGPSERCPATVWRQGCMVPGQCGNERGAGEYGLCLTHTKTLRRKGYLKHGLINTPTNWTPE